MLTAVVLLGEKILGMGWHWVIVFWDWSCRGKLK